MSTLAESVHPGVHNIRASIPFSRLRESLREAAGGQRVVYVPNTGNWGDALINYGARAFLAHCAIEFTEASAAQIKALAAQGTQYGATILVAGNGGWSRHWDHVPAVVEAATRVAHRVILLPTTIDSSPPFVPYDNLQAFVRDHSLSIGHAPSAEFCHDLAFFLPIFEPMRKPLHRELTAFRLDSESARGQTPLPANNLDLSLYGTHVDDPLLFLQFLSGFERILTDRLHIAIGATMIGREVHLWPNDYGKVRAIYESSLRPYFDNIILHEWAGQR